MIKIVKGDLLYATENVIAHQVNTCGVMGGGVAYYIRKKYPNVYQQYVKTCNEVKDRKSLLGQCQICNTGNDRQFVANLFGQLDFGTDKVQTNYAALTDAFERLDSQLSMLELRKPMSVAIPYGIGCGLGGGDWNVVFKIIEETLKFREVTIYRLN